MPPGRHETGVGVANRPSLSIGKRTPGRVPSTAENVPEEGKGCFISFYAAVRQREGRRGRRHSESLNFERTSHKNSAKLCVLSNALRSSCANESGGVVSSKRNLFCLVVSNVNVNALLASSGSTRRNTTVKLSSAGKCVR